MNLGFNSDYINNKIINSIDRIKFENLLFILAHATKGTKCQII